MLTLVLLLGTVAITPKEVSAKSANAKKIPVLTYHMVCTDSQRNSKYKNSSLAVSKSDFKKQMKWLKDNGYRTITCEELYQWYKGEIKLPKKSVLITFDDGAKNVAENAMPILKKYKLKATVFIVGTRTWNNKSGTIGLKKMKKLMKEYPNIEFQSHTYSLHKEVKKKGAYDIVYKDAKKQYKRFGFEYLAYPYGNYNSEMIKAYKAEGSIKMAFTYGHNDYATRDQGIYKLRRIKIDANDGFSKFTRWF